MTDTEISASDLAGTEYQENDIFVALRCVQGEVVQYNIVLPMRAILHTLRKPDPNEILQTNRKVDRKRADDFANGYLYARAKTGDWICPPLTLRVHPSEIVSIEPIVGSVVKIEVPKLRQWLVHDGQHRALGTHYFHDQLSERIAKLRDQAEKARMNGDKQLETQFLGQAEVEKTILEDILDRSSVMLNLVVTSSAVQDQLFADMAIHAKGINPDFALALDHHDPLANIAKLVLEDLPYLPPLISLGQKGRVAKKDDELIGLKSLTDIVRAVSVGGAGRIGKKVHQQLLDEERLWAGRTKEFLQACFGTFSGLRGLVEGTTTASDVKKTSLTGSATMLRVLASVWHEAVIDPTDPHKMVTVKEMRDFMGVLDPHMDCFEDVERTAPDGSTTTVIGVPESKQLWMDTLKFRPGATAPTARPADIADLAQEITRWMREGNEHLGWEGLPKA
jgi:hypothetical protein